MYDQNGLRSIGDDLFRCVGIQVSPPVKFTATSTPFLPVAAQTALEKSPSETMAWSAPSAFSFPALASLLVMA